VRRGQVCSAGPAEPPLAAVEKVNGGLRLAACDPGAVRLGLAPGLTLADARARIPELAVVEADPGADGRLLAELAALCDRYTPLVALDPPHGLLLDVTGCAHLFGGEARLSRQLCGRLRRLGFAVRATLAGTPDAARALVRFAEVETVPRGADEAAARSLPVAALGVAEETVVALSRAGLKRLGDLADRPPETLVARFGADLVRRLERILGRADMRIVPLRPPPDCMVERHFGEPLLDPAGLQAVLRDLMAGAARRLEERGEGGRRFEASFFRTDGAVRRIAVETGRPSRDGDAVLRLFAERFEALADPLDPGSGFDAVRLAVSVCEPLAPVQPGLDGRAVGDEALGQLVDRLVARFGRERVLRFVARDTHLPERAAAAVPAADAAAAALPWPQPEAAEPPLRPLQIFDVPQPIETLAEVPDGPPLRFRWRRVLHEIARAEGPERIAAEWWRVGADEPTRDYFRVEDTAGRRFWVFRQGLYGRESGQPRWFLHGLFA